MALHPKQLDYAYTAAVALNNTGVSLLEHHSLRAALVAFGNALQLIKDLSRFTVEETGKTLHPRAWGSLATVDDMIQQGQRDLAAATTTTTTTTNTVSSTRPYVFCTLQQADLSSEVGSTLRQAMLQTNAAATSDVCYLIRMEGRYCESELDFESAMILHNFGNVYRCLATDEHYRTPRLARSHCERAYKLFQLSYSLLGNLYEDEQERREYHRHNHNHKLHAAQQHQREPTENFLTQLVPVSILVLQSLVAFATLLGHHQQAASLQAHLCEFEDMLLDMEEFMVESIFISAPAA